ncbi:hypothetical protein IAU59_002989 [Kwoniella sp. CBS 9459]
MPTPPQVPRSSLSSSSPSSARLRRIAPSPVKIPPPPSCHGSPSRPGHSHDHATRLPHSQTALTALSNSPSTSRSTPSSTTTFSSRTPSSASRTSRTQQRSKRSSRYDAPCKDGAEEGVEFGLEFELKPLEMTKLCSPDTQIRTLFDLFERSMPPLAMGHASSSNGEPQETKKERKIGVPLIFDDRGEYGKLASSLRGKESGYVEVPMAWAGYQNTPTVAGESRKRRQRTTSSSSCYSNPSSSSSSSATSPSTSSPTNSPDAFAEIETRVWVGCRKRAGSTLCSPARFISKCQARHKEKTILKLRKNPSPIMVEFRTDIFSVEGREKIWQDHTVNESTPRPRHRTFSRSVLLKPEGLAPGSDSAVNHPTAEGRIAREDSAETFATFGAAGNANKSSENPINKTLSDTISIVPVQRKDSSLLDVATVEEDNWSFTLSAYEQDDLSLGPNGKIRKDSFFASSVIAAHAEEMRLASDRSRTIPSHINKDQPNGEQSASAAGAGARAADSLWNPAFTLGITLPSASGSKFVQPYLNHMARAIKVNEGATEGDDSPMSETIITPHAQACQPTATNGHFHIISLGGGIDGNLVDTPTPKNVQSRSSRTPTKPAPAGQDKGLPTLPAPQVIGDDVIFKKSASNARGHPDLTATSVKSKEADIVGGDALKRIDKSLTVQLWVDQEGCRENRTTVKYIRSIKPSVFREREQKALAEAAAWCESPTRPECFQQSGCWEFGMDPKERDKWLFHHAALEGLPVLRRLTINNDDKHDFLPRGATLQIKDPGVYAVCGTEDRGNVEWKFEYLVQPKVSPISGEEIPNERIIVPLAFYASPSFFAPERALRTHLLNVFKKTLTPNIVSEKIRPPHIGKPPTSIAVPSAAPGATPSPANQMVQGVYDASVVTPGDAKYDVAQQSGPSRSGTGRKRAQTQIQPLPSTSSSSSAAASALTSTSTSTSTLHPHPNPHTRSVSRTIGAIAKSIAGITLNASSSTTTTPTKPHSDISEAAATTPGARPSSAGMSIHKFGTKAPTFGRSGSRAKTPTTASGPGLSGAVVGSPSDGAEKGKGRKRSASLFSRSRPFTPPVNITDLHPVPSLSSGNGNGNGNKSAPGPGPAPPASGPVLALHNGKRTSTGLSATSATAAKITQIGSTIISASTLTLPLPLAHNLTSLSLPLPPPSVPAKSHQRRSTPLPIAVHAPAQAQTDPQQYNRGTPAHETSHRNSNNNNGGHPFLHPDSYMYDAPASSPVPSALSLSSSASSSRYSASPLLATPTLSPMPSPLDLPMPGPVLSGSVTPSLTRSASTSSRPKPRPAFAHSRNNPETAEQKEGGLQVQSLQREYPKQIPQAASGMGILGLYPTPRRPAMRKRPSTAEPRLGMR